MRLLRFVVGVVALHGGIACGHMPGQGAANSPTPPDGSGENGGASVSASVGLPTECKQQGRYCVPPGDFVENLCGNKYPGIAILWFAKGTPWVRRYVKLPVVEPRNTTGGPSSDAKLTWGEEVLILKQHGGEGSVRVSGAVDYDVLRWDGTCASMSDLEMTANVPGAPKNAPIAWKYLDSNVQDALLKDTTIQKAEKAEAKACVGKAGTNGFACDHAERNLNAAIVKAVRAGIELPKTPDRMP